jgi:hypothetical protein
MNDLEYENSKARKITGAVSNKRTGCMNRKLEVRAGIDILSAGKSG